MVRLGVRPGRVDALKNAVLLGRGVLELVDHGHRELLRDGLRQAFTLRAVQGCVQAGLHIGKPQLPPAPLEGEQARLHPSAGVAAQHRARWAARVLLIGAHQALKPGKGLGHQQFGGVLFAALDQAGGGEGLQAFVQRRRLQRPVGRGPVLQTAQPPQRGGGAQGVAVPVLALGVELLTQPHGHGLDLALPIAQQRRQWGEPILQGLAQRGLGCGLGPLTVQRAQIALAVGHTAPHTLQAVHRRHRQAVDVFAPIVLHGFGEQSAVVGHQFFVPQAAAVKRVFAQHALAPGVDGEHGRVVHGVGRHGQAPRGAGALGWVGEFGQQAVQKRIGLGARLGRLATKGARGLHQTFADAAGQLVGGGASESHDQNLPGHERGNGAGVATMADHQAHIEGGDGPGFAGAGAGLDQAGAAQRKTQCVQVLGLGSAHTHSSAKASASTHSAIHACNGAYSAMAHWASASAGSASKSGNTRARLMSCTSARSRLRASSPPS